MVARAYPAEEMEEGEGGPLPHEDGDEFDGEGGEIVGKEFDLAD